MIRRVLGFGLAPLLSLVSPILALPAVARASTPDEWVAVGIGLSLGTVGSSLVNTGWSLRGPILAARTSTSEQGFLIVEFFYSCTAMLLPVAAISGITMHWLVPDDAYWLGWTVFLGTSLTAFSPAWWAIGHGKPSVLVYYSAAPRMASMLSAAVLISQTNQIVWYPILLILGSLLGPTNLALKKRVPVFRGWRIGLRRLFGSRADILVATSTTTTGTLYSAGFAVLAGVAISNPTLLIVVVSADRLFRFSVQSIATLTAALQAWVLSNDARIDAERRRHSLTAHLALGVTGALFFGFLAEPATGLLFGARFATTSTVGAAFGVAFIAVSLSSVFGKHFLVPSGRSLTVLRSTTIGAAAGVPAIVGGGLMFGPAGAASGYAASELLVASIQARSALSKAVQ